MGKGPQGGEGTFADSDMSQFGGPTGGNPNQNYGEAAGAYAGAIKGAVDAARIAMQANAKSMTNSQQVSAQARIGLDMMKKERLKEALSKMGTQGFRLGGTNARNP